MLYSRRKWRNRFWLWLARRMPGELAYWCVVRLWDHAIDYAIAIDDACSLLEMPVLKMMLSWHKRPISPEEAFKLTKGAEHPLRDGVWKL